MKNQKSCVKVRLIKPNGETSFMQDFGTSEEAGASDVAIATTFGPNTLENFRVWTDEIAAEISGTVARCP